MQVCIVGFFELDLRNRQGIGKVFFEVISGETREEIEAAIRRRVFPARFGRMVIRPIFGWMSLDQGMITRAVLSVFSCI